MEIYFLPPGNLGAAILLPRDAALRWWEHETKGPPSRARSSSQTALTLLCWHGPWEMQRYLGWDGVDEMGALCSKNPGTFPAPAERSGGAGLEDKDSLWAPFSRSPHQRCGMETPPTSWDTLFPWGGARGEGAGERAEKVAANFPLGCCLYPSHELALGFTACSPGQVCRRSWLAPAWFQWALNALAEFGH